MSSEALGTGIASRRRTISRWGVDRFLLLLPACALVAGCVVGKGVPEIRAFPYPLTYEDDNTQRFSDPSSDAFVEIRKTRSPGPLDNLAVHYASLFPGGEVIRPGDQEDYVKVGDHKAYRVVFRTKYVRKRKRLKDKDADAEIPAGWTRTTIEDPATGNPLPVLYGPVIPQQRLLYLVEGPTHIYYVFLRANGEMIEPARERFEKLVREEMKFL
jgi:hypothetical protein